MPYSTYKKLNCFLIAPLFRVVKNGQDWILTRRRKTKPILNKSYDNQYYVKMYAVTSNLSHEYKQNLLHTFRFLTRNCQAPQKTGCQSTLECTHVSLFSWIALRRLTYVSAPHGVHSKILSSSLRLRCKVFYAYGPRKKIDSRCSLGPYARIILHFKYKLVLRILK